MKEGTILKSAELEAGDLEKIHAFTRTELSADEVFVFSVVLCDNEIDRDFERFSPSALDKLASLYVGKTGIFDHSMKGKDQVARVFACQVEQPAGQITSYGEPYMRLKAKAYMPRTEKNKELMVEIDAGIKKEVSIGCSMGQRVCSVCGADVTRKPCAHQKGRRYPVEGKEVVCCHILQYPTDAYEWSFVAVPAQPAAGVVKQFCRKGEAMTEIHKFLKRFDGQEDPDYTKEEIEDLVAELKAAYVDLQEEIVTLGKRMLPAFSEKSMRSLLAHQSFAQLKELKKDLEKMVDQTVPPRSQIPVTAKTPKGEHYKNFKI